MTAMKDRIDPRWVRSQVYRVSLASEDNEAAHAMEDELHQSVLRHIADGTAENPRECAEIALATQRLDFDRGYA